MFSGLVELASYRGLVRNLVSRDLKVRYRGSILGFLWCFANPLLMTAVFTVVFTVLMKNNIPNFSVFVLTGLLGWNLFNTAIMGAIGSITTNAGLVMKVYFPREVLPISVILANTVNFVFALVVLFALIFASGIRLGSSVALLPVVLLIQLTFMLGLGLFLSALTVFFRDVGIIMETALLAWFFLTPIFYRMEDLIPAYSRVMYIVNPMASIISAYRDILYLGGYPAPDFLIRTAITAVVFLVFGYVFFRRFAPRFGEEL